MRIDTDELGRYYASISDEELCALDRSELSEAAQHVYDEEISRRKLEVRSANASEAEENRSPPPSDIDATIVATPADPEGGFPGGCSVMVPGALLIHATSVLDRDVFNAKQAAEWRTLFADLTDEELSALDPEIFCAGLLDRAARLKRAYREEVARRK